MASLNWLAALRSEHSAFTALSMPARYTISATGTTRTNLAEYLSSIDVAVWDLQVITSGSLPGDPSSVLPEISVVSKSTYDAAGDQNEAFDGATIPVFWKAENTTDGLNSKFRCLSFTRNCPLLQYNSGLRPGADTPFYIDVGSGTLLTISFTMALLPPLSEDVGGTRVISVPFLSPENQRALLQYNSDGTVTHMSPAEFAISGTPSYPYVLTDSSRFSFPIEQDVMSHFGIVL
jgi:hypothetical protein